MIYLFGYTVCQYDIFVKIFHNILLLYLQQYDITVLEMTCNIN